jgi:signal transduction histidine kinase
VNDVLDLSKIEAGKIDVVREPVDIATLLDDMMSTIEPMASSRGCELRRESERCELVVQTDPRRVRQVLLNLLSNATKFGAGHPVTLRCRPFDDGVVVEVRDEGPGIAEADVPRIFDEFVQLAGTEGGTGLGLAISRRLAQLLGGRLEVDTAPGRGSTFRLVLPRRGRWTGSAAVATVEG